MALIRGNQQEQGNGGKIIDEASLRPEDRRKVQLGTVMDSMRRYWRFFCLGMFVFTVVISLIQGDTDTLTILVLKSAFCWVVIYLGILWVFLYLLCGYTLKFILYMRDLLGGNKDTRI